MFNPMEDNASLSDLSDFPGLAKRPQKTAASATALDDPPQFAVETE